MAALAANATGLVDRQLEPIVPQVVNAAEVYSGSIMCLNSRGHGTSGSRGRAQAFSLGNF